MTQDIRGDMFKYGTSPQPTQRPFAAKINKPPFSLQKIEQIPGFLIHLYFLLIAVDKYLSLGLVYGLLS